MEKKINQTSSLNNVNLEKKIAPKRESVVNARQNAQESYQEKLVAEKEKPLQRGAISSFFFWFKKDWIIKAGGLFLILGFAWLATYAFLNNWIGPIGRISLGLVGGAGFLLLGFLRIKKHVNQGGVFLVVGSTTILLTTFAARVVYNFFDPLLALAMMFLSAFFVALVALINRNYNLVLVGFILASIAPMLVNSPTSDYVTLFLYLSMIIIGVLWVAAKSGKRSLVLVALLSVLFYSLPHLLFGARTSLETKNNLLFIIYFLVAVFSISDIFSIIKTKGKAMIVDIIIAAGNGLLLFWWIIEIVGKDLRGIIFILWAVIFMVTSFFIFKKSRRKIPFYIYSGLSIIMLAATTAVELSGAILNIIYAVEGGVFAFLSYIALRDFGIAKKASAIFLFVPIILSFKNILGCKWFNDDFFVLFVTGGIIFLLGLFFNFIKKIEAQETDNFGSGLIIISSIYAYIILWQSLHLSLKGADMATTISLIIYTIAGLISYFYGIKKKNKISLRYGEILIGFIVARLIIIDIWEMSIAKKIITFFLIGAFLVSASFFNNPSNKKSLK